MKRLQRTLLGSGLLALGLSANAQVYRDDPYYRNNPYNRNDPYNRNGDYRNRSYGSYGGPIIDQVQADLDGAASTSYLSGGQRRRIDHARQKLWEFQDRRQREGRFDTHKLDDAIDNIQHLVNSDGIRYRDRSILEADLQRLRELRSYRNGDYPGHNPYYRR